ncbi:hypothetical protein PMPD1_3724 [Paramixta manurensis]|uniref:Uncharacterized protein n=1 Tax=Paramixta manurensis TaxID=2740817 RepID=A0A6M8UD61_9GAMM|nr:hypothetical protein PMPD1_3724 [Erwiniaceae bacterium PD-1]
MMKSKCVLLALLTLMLPGSGSAQTSGSSVSLDVGAESVARVVVYYHDVPVTGNNINFPLPINGLSQHFERVSDFFYVVGNVEQADVVFSDSSFVLYSTSGANRKINLSGEFIFQNSPSSALKPLHVPVLKNISEATVATGFKVHFTSEFLAGNYTQDTYANSFTLLVKPIP